MTRFTVVRPYLNEIMAAGDRCKGDLGIRTAEVVIAIDQVVFMWVPTRAIMINGELRVVAAATEAHSDAARMISIIGVPDVWAFHAEAGTIERRISGVERQVRYVTDRYCVITVVVGGPAVRQHLVTDVQYTLTRVAFPPSNLNQVLSANSYIEFDLRLLAAEIVVASDHVLQLRGAIAPIIDGKLGVVAAAAQADGEATALGGGIDVPDVRGGRTVAGTVERRRCSVERQVRYVTDRRCVRTIIIGWNAQSEICHTEQ